MDVDDEGSVEGQEKRWDEGLTKEERSEAKRKYKNRRSAERWRRRKKEEKARAKAESSQGASVGDLSEEEVIEFIATTPNEECQLAYAARQATQNMLFEHCKLGKSGERDFLFQLQQLSAFSIIPGGFQQYKEDILLIAEKAVDVLQGGGSTQLKAAQRYASYIIEPNREWYSPTTPHWNQLCSAFMTCREGELKVPLSICGKPNARFSLKQLSNLPAPVQAEIYFGGINQIKHLLTMATASHSQSHLAMEQASEKLRELFMLLSAFVIGNSSMFTIARTVRPQEKPSTAQLMSAAASMGLTMETCRQLWQVWDELMLQMTPLLAIKAAQEREIEAILSMMDHSGQAPYVDLLQKVRELLGTYQQMMDANVLTELRCSMEILTPFQCCMLHVANLPRMTAKEAWYKGIDPVLRMSTIFQQGLIPYRMP